MALTPRLELRQSQSLVMTPQLQQAIKLLQLSNLELSDFVSEQIEKNPLLEIDDGNGQDANKEAAPVKDETPPNEGGDSETPLPLTETDHALEAHSPGTDASASLDTDYENLYADESRADIQNKKTEDAQESMTMDWSSAGTGGSSNFDSMESTIESTLSSEQSLRDVLLEQLNVSIEGAMDRVIGADIIDNLDEAGYLTCSLESIAERLGTDTEQIEEVLHKMQSFEPAGVCARDLAECLKLQLMERNRYDPAIACLLNNLDLLAKHDMTALREACQVDDEDMAEMIQEIRDLDPKPGLAHSSEITQPVVPDVFVKSDNEGGWRIELNSDTLPKVLLNERYYSEVSASANSKDEKAYLNECFNNANWLVKSLDQRAKTILKVATELVKQQDSFLVHGIQHLRPLNLKTIADAISMHESTVSRVTANKYIATPRGLFELKYFFTSAIASTSGGEAHSAEAVRHRIKELIDEESPSKILSDDRIVELLKDAGIDIARRTVAKYREAMHIPSSVQRRRLKKQPA